MASKLSTSDMRFLETGTILKSNIFKILMRDLLNYNVDQYKMLT